MKRGYEVRFSKRPGSKRRIGMSVRGLANSFNEAMAAASINCPDDMYVSEISQVRTYDESGKEFISERLHRLY